MYKSHEVFLSKGFPDTNAGTQGRLHGRLVRAVLGVTPDKAILGKPVLVIGG